MSFSNPIVGGEGGELVRASIKSPDYVPNTSGWIIRRDGSAEFNDIVIRGGAFVGGDIIIGPAGMPQVHIGSDANRGFVEFPTNNMNETAPGYIAGQDNDGGPFFNLSTRIESPAVAGGQKSYVLFNSASTTGISPPNIIFGIGPTGGINNRFVIADDLTTAFTEMIVGSTAGSRNHPTRVVRGRTNTSSVATAIGAGVDTSISNASSASVQLINNNVYKVDIQIRTQSTSGAQAPGLQGLQWKLWDGAVGGTQLGPSIQKFMESNTSGSSSQQFSFLFRHTGTTGTRTINLSAQTFTGTNTNSATVSNQYYMLVNLVSNAAQIANI